MISFKLILKKIKEHSDLCGYIVSFLITVGVALFFLYNPLDFEKEKIDGNNNAISINLATFAPPSKAPIKDKVVKKQHKKKKKKPQKKVLKAPLEPVPSTIEAILEEPTQEDEPIEEEVVTEEESTTPPSTENNSDTNIKTLRDSDGIDDPYLRAIRNEVEKHNKYPGSAYNRRLSGEVMIKFLIKTNGDVEDVEVLSSSKHDVLNKAALKAVLKAKKFFPKPVETIYIIIPINYALQFN